MSRQDQLTLDLILKARSGNQQAFNKILTELEPELRKIAHRYYINGSDKEDVLQEGRIGVWKAVQDYKPDKDMQFRNFAIGLCCKRHVITAMAAANRKKYDPLNNAVSLETPVNTGEEDNEQSLAEFIPDNSPAPIDVFILREEFEEVSRRVRKRLTQLEDAIYEEYAFEESYRDIARELGIKSKAVDNALMRIRKKATEEYLRYLKEEKEVNDDVDLLDLLKERIVEDFIDFVEEEFIKN